MKVYMMTDIEGVAGVMNSTDWIYPDSRYYEKGKEFLTKEVNAAIDGFFAAGATEIIVQDGHGHGAINFEMLDPRAKLQRGWDNSDGGYAPWGLDESYDVMAYIGQHPKAGTEYGHLTHTGMFYTLDYEVNGISIGEFGKGALAAPLYGVMPILATGCLAFTKEAEALVPGIETVAVKEGVMPGTGDELSDSAYERRNWGAIHLHPIKARELIREAAYRAMRRFIEHPETFHPTIITPPFSKRVVFRKMGGEIHKTIERSGYDDFAKLLNA